MRLERKLVHLYAAAYVVSWTGVIKYHGPKPTQRAGHVYVANHTSMARRATKGGGGVGGGGVSRDTLIHTRECMHACLCVCMYVFM